MSQNHARSWTLLYKRYWWSHMIICLPHLKYKKSTAEMFKIPFFWCDWDIVVIKLKLNTPCWRTLFLFLFFFFFQKLEQVSIRSKWKDSLGQVSQSLKCSVVINYLSLIRSCLVKSSSEIHLSSYVSTTLRNLTWSATASSNWWLLVLLTMQWNLNRLHYFPSIPMIWLINMDEQFLIFP